MKKKSRKGFTLIELFLVIVVIVILAGAIMVSGDESVVSAEADNIINNMRILKTAALEWLADYGDYIDPNDHRVTYPYPAIMPIEKRNNAKQCIQDVMKEDYPQGRQTMMKYVNSAYKRKKDGDIDISLNQKTSEPYAKSGGYAIIDASGGDGDGMGSEISDKWSKWYVVYNPIDSKHEKKVMKKLENRAVEEGLYVNNKDNKGDYYTADAKPNYVYMKIIDLSEK